MAEISQILYVTHRRYDTVIKSTDLSEDTLGAHGMIMWMFT